jgi:hypothetical protein
MKLKSIKQTEIEECFKNLGWSFTSINMKITEDQSEHLLQQLKMRKKNLEQLQVKGNTILRNIRPIKELPQQFKHLNKFEKEVLQIVQGESDYLNRDLRMIRMDENLVESRLTDFEAFSICRGLKDRWSKKMSVRYFSGDHDDELIFLAHNRAIETIEKYGDILVLHLITLPSLPFQASSSHQIFSHLDQKKKITQDPIVRLWFEKEKIQFSFYRKPETTNGSYYPNVIVARSKSTNEDLFLLSRDGKCVPLSATRNIGPLIQTFISYSGALEEQIIHYGLQTGECSICGRPLSDPESLRIGIGPICREGMSI